MNIHAGIKNPEVNLALNGTVLSLLVVHAQCTAGQSDSPESRSPRRQLLEVADARGLREPGGGR